MRNSRHIHIGKFAMLQAVMFGLIGLICGVLYGIGGLLIDTLVSLGMLSPESFSTPGLSIGTLLALGALIGMPVIFAALGYFLGLLEAVLFNIFSRWLGHIRTDLGVEKD